MPFNFLNKDKTTRDYYYGVSGIWHRLASDHWIKQVIVSTLLTGVLGLIYIFIKNISNDF